MNSLSTKEKTRRSELTRMRILFASVLCMLASGCRNDPYLNSHIEILNAEKRALEDQLYELEYDFERKVAELEDTREQLKQLETDGTLPPPSSSIPQVEIPDLDDEFFDLSPPSVTPGIPDGPSIELPEPTSSARSTRSVIDTQPVSTGTTRLEPADPRITHIHINPEQTAGTDFDPKPGDDGILLVIEPRNGAEAFVPLAGPLTVVVLDYAKQDTGDEARIARWELTAKQVDQSLKNNATQRGIYLRLPWGDDRPQSSRLMVAVRYSTADGRTLEAKRDVFITLPGQLSQRWTPRSTSGVDDADHENRDEQGSINIARQPSTTDGASATPKWSPFR